MELKCSHVRSLSEQRMQISLERNDAAAKAEARAGAERETWMSHLALGTIGCVSAVIVA